MDDLIAILESFNRKERFFLISHALRGPQGKPVFTLADDFRQELEDKVEICIPGKDVFVAMDYHLDWLYAGLTKWQAANAGVTGKSVFPNPWSEFPDIKGKKVKVVRGDSEDVDLLVAFRQGGQYHLILVEAKAYSGWSNDQLKSKANRLREIFGDDGKGFGGVKPHFCLMGPKESAGLNLESSPDWMKPIKWLTLALPPERRVVTRRGKDGGSYRKFEIKTVQQESA